MARARLLKPGFFRDEALAKLPIPARYLFEGLWCLADRQGRLRDNVKAIDAEVFPYDKQPTEKFLNALADAGFIHRYEAEESRCIWIPKFLQHQRPHPNE